MDESCRRSHEKHKRRVREQYGDVPTKADLFNEQNGNCAICGKSIDMGLKFPDPWFASYDHIVPLSRGGDHVPSNIQLAHLSCNKKKFTMTMDEYRKSIELAASIYDQSVQTLRPAKIVSNSITPMDRLAADLWDEIMQPCQS